jgi:type VI secretion system protein ImpH
MANAGGTMRDPLALLARLEQQPAAFDFHGALRQIECAYGDLPRLGQARTPGDEAVRFGQLPSLAFEPAMFASLQRGDDEQAPRLLVNLFGMLGANGPLPVHLTDYIRDRQRNFNDPTLARFCDIFHHRMISLFYRAWANAQPTVSLDRPQDDRFSVYVASLIGLGMPSLRGRDAAPDIAKLHHAGRLSPQNRNAEGLGALLSDFFQVPVQVQTFVGHWMTLPTDGIARLRSGLDAEVLGMTTVLGKNVWNAQHKFRLVIGPLDLPQAHNLLPGASGMQRLQAWVRQYAGLTLEWDVNLILRKEQVPGLRLGRDARLGWSTWLSSKTPDRDDRQLLVSPRRLAASAPPSTRGPDHG